MIRKTHPEASPAIAHETAISRIPDFAKKVNATINTTFTKLLSSPKQMLASAQSKFKQMDISKAPFAKYLKTPIMGNHQCKCSHILVADDDDFQLMYYQNLFQKSLDFEQIGVKKEEFRYELCSSGEELVEKFIHMQTCTCKKLRVIVTDYQMGEKKLNGFSTSLKLRELGHKGPVLLRTAENKQELIEKHTDLEIIIDVVIEKGNIGGGKETIMKYLKSTTEKI